MRLKTSFQLAGIAYGIYLAWWFTRGWPDCCPHCEWDEPDCD